MIEDEKTVTFWFCVGLLLTLVGAALVSSSGCSSFGPLEMQQAVTAGAEVTEDLDNELAPLVAGAAQRCDREQPTREGFLECIAPYTPIHWGIRGLRATWRLGQTTVDAWRAGQRDGAAAWLDIAACGVYGVSLITNVVRLLNLDVPIAEALAWVDVFGRLALTRCPSTIFGATEASGASSVAPATPEAL